MTNRCRPVLGDDWIWRCTECGRRIDAQEVQERQVPECPQPPAATRTA